MFFFVAAEGILGLALGSIASTFTHTHHAIFFVAGAGALAALLLFAQNKPIYYALPLLIAGIYSLAYGAVTKPETIVYEKPVTITGTIVDVRHMPGSQSLTLKSGVVIYTDKYPEFEYGDRIRFKGTVEQPTSPKNTGTVLAYRTPIEKVGPGRGSALQSALIRIRTTFEASIKRLLPAEQANFLTGLTVGTTENFSREFKDAMRRSGTTHLTALSGSNISGIVTAIIFLLGFFFAPRQIFYPTLLIITLFVMMTGAEASLVRAALMNVAVLFAKRAERATDPKNIIALAALIMLIINPRLIVFDLGFQLSFAAIIGLTYIAPYIKERVPAIPKLVNDCVSAQLAVTPVLFLALSKFALWTILPNILIVFFIPYTTGLGFLAGGLGLIHPTLGFAPAWIAGMLLRYEMAVIYFFSYFD